MCQITVCCSRGWPLNFPPLNFPPPNCQPPTTANSDLTRRGNIIFRLDRLLSKLPPPNISSLNFFPLQKICSILLADFRFVHFKIIRGKLFLRAWRVFSPPKHWFPLSTKLTPNQKFYKFSFRDVSLQFPSLCAN